MKISIFFIISILLTVISSGMIFAFAQTTDYGGIVGYRVADFKSNDASFQILYKITNATVTSTPLDLQAKALFFFINATNDGKLTVELPRSIIDSKNNDVDKPYFVTGEKNTGISKVDTTETSDVYVRTLEINFTKDTSEIEIVGNMLVVKYPVAKVPFVMSPLQQLRSGILVQDVKCPSNFQLVFKSKDDSPACVKPENVSMLVKRGWAKQELNHVVHVEPKVTLNDYSYNGIDKENNMTVSINNQAYYQTTIDYSGYNLPKSMPMQFHNVIFTFPAGTMTTPGGAFVMLDMKFQDGFEEVYGTNTGNEFGGIHFPTQYGPHMAENSTTVLSNHMMPQAGMTIYHDKIKLLVSK